MKKTEFANITKTQLHIIHLSQQFFTKDKFCPLIRLYCEKIAFLLIQKSLHWVKCCIERTLKILFAKHYKYTLLFSFVHSIHHLCTLYALFVHTLYTICVHSMYYLCFALVSSFYRCFVDVLEWCVMG